MTDADRAVLSRRGCGKKVGFGNRPVLLLIELQNYERGDKEEPLIESIKRFPLSCGEAAWKAVRKIQKVLDIARAKKVPIVYTRTEIEPDTVDARSRKRKTDMMPKTENSQYAGTWGTRMIDETAPQPGDIVLLKHRNSAFFGTPLNAWFTFLGIDTVIVGGGTTSSCIRATVFDSNSLGYRTIVMEDCVYDRVKISHEINLFDMAMEYADVVPSEEVILYLRSL